MKRALRKASEPALKRASSCDAAHSSPVSIVAAAVDGVARGRVARGRHRRDGWQAGEKRHRGHTGVVGLEGTLARRGAAQGRAGEHRAV